MTNPSTPVVSEADFEIVVDDRQRLLKQVRGLEEQLEAVTRVAEAAKTYRDVRGDYTWVQMIQALDAWENPNPASEPECDHTWSIPKHTDVFRCVKCGVESDNLVVTKTSNQDKEPS